MNEEMVIQFFTSFLNKEISKSLGYVIPSVRIRDDLNLEPNLYQIKIGQRIVAEDKIFTDRKLAMPSDDTQIKIQGIETKDPSFGMTAYWIEKHLVSKAESNGYMVIDPEAVIGTHLNQVLIKYAGELISQAVTAMEAGLSAEDIALTCHAHPTLSESMKEAASLASIGKTLHF